MQIEVAFMKRVKKKGGSFDIRDICDPGHREKIHCTNENYK